MRQAGQVLAALQELHEQAGHETAFTDRCREGSCQVIREWVLTG